MGFAFILRIIYFGLHYSIDRYSIIYRLRLELLFPYTYFFSSVYLFFLNKTYKKDV
jgi:hypothetical protein